MLSLGGKILQFLKLFCCVPFFPFEIINDPLWFHHWLRNVNLEFEKLEILNWRSLSMR